MPRLLPSNGDPIRVNHRLGRVVLCHDDPLDGYVVARFAPPFDVRSPFDSRPADASEETYYYEGLRWDDDLLEWRVRA